MNTRGAPSRVLGNRNRTGSRGLDRARPRSSWQRSYFNAHPNRFRREFSVSFHHFRGNQIHVRRSSFLGRETEETFFIDTDFNYFFVSISTSYRSEIRNSLDLDGTLRLADMLEPPPFRLRCRAAVTAGNRQSASPGPIRSSIPMDRRAIIRFASQNYP